MEIISWLKAEEETATAEFEKYRLEYLAGGSAWKDAKKQRDYWAGYSEAVTNALHKLTGMGE